MTRLALACALILGACSPEWAIGHAFGDDPHLEREALAIAECESNMDPDAVSPTNDHGLMQINAPTWNKPGHPDPVAQYVASEWEHVYDPVVNALMARKIYDAYGWSMWSCRWVVGE